jgi:hypothetical protein
MKEGFMPNQWIPCRKRQPPGRNKYLVLRYNNTTVASKFYDPVNGWGTTVPVLYWQPVPDYPPGYLAGEDEENVHCTKLLQGEVPDGLDIE